jgi:hypothetical protein
MSGVTLSDLMLGLLIAGIVVLILSVLARWHEGRWL